MKFRSIILMAFLLVPAVGLSAIEVLDVSFFPPRFYVGDQVEAVMTVRSDYADSLEAPDIMPESQWVEYHRVQVRPVSRDKISEIHISFTAYVPGTVTLPALQLGPETLKGYEVLVNSLQAQYGSNLREIKSQMLVPGTQLALWLFSLGVLLLPLLWLLIAHYGADWLALVKARVLARRPYRRVQAALRRLLKGAEAMSEKDFYIELLTVLRRYFSEKSGTDCMSATSHEIERILGMLSQEGEIVQELKDVFYFGDRVKFAGAVAPTDIRFKHIARIIRITAVLEHKEPRYPAQVADYVHI